MRILMLNPVGTIGGAERCLLTAVRALVALGHEIHVMPCTAGPLDEAAALAGAKVTPLPMPSVMASTGDSGGMLGAVFRSLAALPASWLYARRLGRAIADIHPDVIHSNGLKMHLLTSAAKPAAPVVWHLHDFVGQRRLASRLLRRAARHMTRAIAISNAVASDARAVLGDRPIDTVLNAIDTSRFSPQGPAANLDGLAGAPPAVDGAIRVGLVATYARWKGHDVFIRAAAKVRRTLGEAAVRFYIIGGPIYHTAGSQWSAEELQRLAGEQGLSGDLFLAPFQSDTSSIFRALDIVVHASTRPEPFGLTIAEAMACGRATIVSSAGGAAELFTPDIDAMGFAPGDIDGLADRIARLVSHLPLRISMGQAARNTAATRFSDTRYGGELVQVYTQAMPPLSK